MGAYPWQPPLWKNGVKQEIDFHPEWNRSSGNLRFPGRNVKSQKWKGSRRISLTCFCWSFDVKMISGRQPLVTVHTGSQPPRPPMEMCEMCFHSNPLWMKRIERGHKAENISDFWIQLSTTAAFHATFQWSPQRWEWSRSASEEITALPTTGERQHWDLEFRSGFINAQPRQSGSHQKGTLWRPWTKMLKSEKKKKKKIISQNIQDVCCIKATTPCWSSSRQLVQVVQTLLWCDVKPWLTSPRTQSQNQKSWLNTTCRHGSYLLTTLFNYTPVVMETHEDEDIIALDLMLSLKNACASAGFVVFSRRLRLVSLRSFGSSKDDLFSLLLKSRFCKDSS